MKCEQVERKMPQTLKDRIVSHLRLPESHGQCESLTELLTDPTNLANLYKKLSGDELQTLRLILASFGCLSFTEEKLQKEATQHMAGAQVRYGLMGLRRYGIIIAFRKSWGDQLFVLPEDAFAGWQWLLFPSRLSHRGDHESELEPVEIGDLSEYGNSHINGDDCAVSPRGLAQQLFHFLVSCSRQSVFPFTNKGTLYKKQVLKLTEHVRLPHNVITMSGLTYAFTDVYNEPSALMLEMALRMGFLSTNEAKDGYALDHLSIQSWLEGSYTHQQAQLYRIWRQALIPAPVWLEHAIAIMETEVIGHWANLDELFQAIRLRCSVPSTARHIEDEEATSLRQTLMRTWITPLLAFGFIEVGKGEQERLWFRWLIMPREMLGVDVEHADANDTAASIYVQPDFELLLPPDVSLLTEWQVAAFADLQNSDLVRTYRLTKESFGRALDEGMQGGDVLRVLQANTCYELPAGVVITLQQWDEQKDKLSLSEVTLLRCQSADIAEALLRNEKCRPFLGERIGETNFIVAQDVVKRLTKCLETMGFHPNKRLAPKPSAAPVARAASVVNIPTGLCYSRDTIQLYEIDPQLPQQDDLYPDMQQIPSSWIKELRDYHASTRKDMIRKAIEWKSVLQLRKEGRDCFIIPRRVREERTGWLVEGWEDYQEISWSGDDWNEMKLILPGINDGRVREKEETLREL